MPPTRFVILHHRQHDGEHWDLMIEQVDNLATWQLLVDPITHNGEAIDARRIGDHRKAYLTYEGPVSRDRGDVRRIESGTCEILSADSEQWLVRFVGQHLAGDYVIHSINDSGRARFERIAS